jgi:hypothetical protein
MSQRPISLPTLEAGAEVSWEVKVPKGAPVFVGDGEHDFLCGACESVLCSHMRRDALAGMVFRCHCGTLSFVPGRWRAPEAAANPSP